MSKYTLQVLFDREDRTYRFNEEVSGKVVLDTQSNLSCKKIWIDYGWRTHGKGNIDKGGMGVVNLSLEARQFRSGEHREYAFKFTAPNGPVTYHGTYINVDWYLTAHVDVSFARNPRTEQDFLLIPSESPAIILLGEYSLSKSPPPIHRQNVPLSLSNDPEMRINKPSKDPFASKSWVPLVFLALMVFGFLSTSFILQKYSSWWPIIPIIFAAIIAAIIIYVFIREFSNLLGKQKIKISIIQIEPSEVYQGEQVTCRLQFHTKRAVYLENIAAMITAEEVAVSGGGTNQSTYKKTVYKHSFVKPYGEGLMAGRSVNFDGILTIASNAPATFKATNNNLSWFVKVKISFKRWPDWQTTIPMTVLPG